MAMKMLRKRRGRAALGALGGVALTLSLGTLPALAGETDPEGATDPEAVPVVYVEGEESSKVSEDPLTLQETPVLEDGQPATEEGAGGVDPAPEGAEAPEAGVEGKPEQEPGDRSGGEASPVVAQMMSLPAPVAEVAPAGKIESVTRDGCTVTITAATEAVGDFAVDIWDDGEVLYTDAWTTTKSGTHTTKWTISKPAGKDATGVGIYLTLGGAKIDRIDPWEYPDSVANECSAAVSVTATAPGYDSAKGVEAGAKAPIAGAGFLPGETVIFTVGGVEVGSAVVGDDGTFEGTFVVPEGVDPGSSFMVTVTGEESLRSITVTFTVAGAAAAS